MEPIKPEVVEGEFKTAKEETVTPLLLAFRRDSYFREDIISD